MFKKNVCNKITIAILSMAIAPAMVSAEELFGPVQSSGDLSLIPADGSMPSYTLTNNEKVEQAQKQATVAQQQQQAQQSAYSTSTLPTAQVVGLPVVPSNVRENASKKAFDSAMKSSMGLSPDMVREVKRSYTEKQKAYNENFGVVAKSEERSIVVGLGTNKNKEVIRTASGNATAIMLVDSTGRPWDVYNVTVGDPNAFDLQRLDGPEGSLFSVTSRKDGVKSNLIFTLKEGKGKYNKIPVSIDLVSGQSQVDTKLTIRVQGVGPNGSIEQSRISEGVDSKYIAWLDGVVPSGVKKLKSDNPLLKAWRDDDGSIIVISKYLVYSPSSSVMLSSGDGEAHLYKLAQKRSVLLVRDLTTKEESKVRISGF